MARVCCSSAGFLFLNSLGEDALLTISHGWDVWCLVTMWIMQKYYWYKDCNIQTSSGNFFVFIVFRCLLPTTSVMTSCFSRRGFICSHSQTSDSELAASTPPVASEGRSVVLGCRRYIASRARLVFCLGWTSELVSLASVECVRVCTRIPSPPSHTTVCKIPVDQISVPFKLRLWICISGY